MEEQLGEWLKCITDVNCYQEEIRFCTAQCLEILELSLRTKSANDRKEKNTLNNVVESVLTSFACRNERYVVDELVAVIAGSEFFDVFCVRNIVKIVECILKMTWVDQRSLCQDLTQVKKQIQLVKQKWCDKSCFRVSNHCSVEFDRSQQVVQCCNACLNTIGGIPWVF